MFRSLELIAFVIGDFVDSQSMCPCGTDGTNVPPAAISIQFNYPDS